MSGRTNVRVYSSEKDRCMKAGITINVDSVQLLGGSSDDVPRRLFDEHGAQHDVSKWYLTDVKDTTLKNVRGDVFTVDPNGWVSPQKQDNVDTNADGSKVQVY